MKSYTRMDTQVKWYRKHIGDDAFFKEATTIMETIDKYIGKEWKKLTSAERKEYIDSLLLREYYALDLNIHAGNATHIFLTSMEFCDWIVSCVNEPNLDHARVISEFAGGDSRIGCLHFPADGGKVSVGFRVPRTCISVDPDKPLLDYSALFMSFSRGGKLGYSYIPFPYSAWKENEFSTWYGKLITGLGMYISCFPEQSIDGIPADLKHDNWFKRQTNKTIGIANEVVTHDGPTPHYRVGHFAFLQSERFTHKRGQTVFRHGCFVKGQAKTVLSTDNPQTTIVSKTD